MKSSNIPAIMLSSAWMLGNVLNAAQAANMSSNNNNTQYQNPWRGTSTYGVYQYPPTYAPRYGYGSHLENNDNKKPLNSWSMMYPSHMMNMMPNPMNMFSSNEHNNTADYPPLPVQNVYPYAHSPGAYPHPYQNTYPYQDIAPLGQSNGAYRGDAPTQASQHEYAPPPPPKSYPAPSRNHKTNHNRSGMGMNRSNQQNKHPNYFPQSQNPNYQQAYQPHRNYYPQQTPSAMQNQSQGVLVDRSSYQAPPPAMQPLTMSNEKPLVNRGNAEPPPVPKMPPRHQGYYGSANPYPYFPQHSGQTSQTVPNTNTHTYPTQNYGNQGYGSQISPQAGSPYSIPPVSPGLDMYPGQNQNLQVPPTSN